MHPGKPSRAPCRRCWGRQRGLTAAASYEDTLLMNPIIENLERTNSDLINLFVLAAGAATVFASLLCGRWPDVKNTLLSVGCSLVATAIVTYLTSRYMARSGRIRRLVDQWGVGELFLRKSEIFR